jgi:hypothetical protein
MYENKERRNYYYGQGTAGVFSGVVTALLIQSLCLRSKRAFRLAPSLPA